MIIIDYSLPPTPAKRFETKASSIVIGRSIPGHAVDLDLTPDSTVSRRHAHLTYEEGVYALEDLGSKFGTFVNDRKIIRKVQLKPGDRVHPTPLSFDAANYVPVQ